MSLVASALQIVSPRKLKTVVDAFQKVKRLRLTRATLLSFAVDATVEAGKLPNADAINSMTVFSKLPSEAQKYVKALGKFYLVALRNLRLLSLPPIVPFTSQRPALSARPRWRPIHVR